MSCGVAMSCGVCGVGRSGLLVLVVWHRLATTARIRPLDWVPPYATDAALEKDKKKKIPLQIFLVMFQEEAELKCMCSI